MFLILGLVGIFYYQDYLFPESEKEMIERRTKIFETVIKDYDNSKSGKIDLTELINIRWRINEFKAENHKIRYCENEYQDAKYVCKIDGEEWFGSDFKMDLPKYELKTLSIFIDGKYVKLKISQMFNPNSTGELNKNQFKIKKESNYYILYGYFSDGAGTYTAHWKIKNGVSERIALSYDEEDFEWQNSK